MNRIPYPEPSQLSAAKQAYLDAPDLRVLNIARISMHAPDPIWRATVDLALAVVTDTISDDRLREVIVLRVANLSNSKYELFHHLSLARSLGFSDAELEASRSGDFAALPARDRLVAQFTTEVVRDVDPSDETVTAMRAEFSDEHIFEMLAIIGSYMNAARVAAVARIGNDDVAVTSWAKERETE